MNKSTRPTPGFTLIEAVIVIAVIAIVLVLAAPAMTRMIELRRLRGTNEQFQTDVQFLRSEAVSRQERTAISFSSDATMTCYVIHTCGTQPDSGCWCDCTLAASSSTSGRCDSTTTMREIRTVQIPRSSGVQIIPVRVASAASIANRFLLDPTSGSMVAYIPVTVTGVPPAPPTDFWTETSLTASSAGPTAIRTRVGALGRPTTCTATGNLPGVAPC